VLNLNCIAGDMLEMFNFEGKRFSKNY